MMFNIQDKDGTWKKVMLIISLGKDTLKNRKNTIDWLLYLPRKGLTNLILNIKKLYKFKLINW